MITERSKAIILLAGYLPGSDRNAKPLSVFEWNKFALWLHKKGLLPEDLLGVNQDEIVNDWEDIKIPKLRLQQLLKRGGTMAICLDKWQRAGIWVINRSDPEYPQQFKHELKQKSPPLFYGVGNRKILKTEAIGVVGSRNITEKEMSYAYKLGATISENGFSVISGGAKGIDENSMLGALSSEGTCIGILADRLLKKSTSKIYRKHIMQKNLVFISPYHPEAGFNVGNAMSRNKFIYLKSRATFVVHSGVKGGTWNGALENLKYNWVPLFVKRNNDPTSGNVQLIKKGANILEDSPSDIKFDFNQPKKSSKQPNLFSVQSKNGLDDTSVDLTSKKLIVTDKLESQNPIFDKFFGIEKANCHISAAQCRPHVCGRHRAEGQRSSEAF